MDKKSRNLNIITSATVTLLTKAKLKGETSREEGRPSRRSSR